MALPAATPAEFKNGAAFAFGNFTNCVYLPMRKDLRCLRTDDVRAEVNGWPNGYAFVLSFLAPVWTIGKSSHFVEILGYTI